MLILSQILEYLILHKLSNMSGAGQKIVFNLLKEVLYQGLCFTCNVNCICSIAVLHSYADAQ